MLDEREFELINIIGGDLGSNQRDLSHQMNLSLGMVNMLIKRMISKGYIRITQLNKRKVKYLLTPKGFAEKMRKSVKYTLKTISSIELIKQNVKTVMMELLEKGEKTFVVLGKSDFAHLIEIVLKELQVHDYKIIFIDRMPKEKVDGILLICKEVDDQEDDYGYEKINLIHEIAKNQTFINNRGE